MGQHSSTNTPIEVATNTMALKHAGLWLTIEGWVGVGGTDNDNDKMIDTKPSHSHPPHPTTKPPPFHPSSLSNSPLCLLPIPQHSPALSFCTLCACHTAATTHHLIAEERKKEGLRVRGRKGVAHLSGFFEVTKPLNTSQQSSTHTETKRKKEKTVTAIPRGKHHFSSDQ